MSEAPEILFEQRGGAGLVTLNRPGALNALTHTMVRRLHSQLDRWHDDPAVTRVIIMGAGERAFSSGGDVRYLYDLGRAGRQKDALLFMREEYELNAAIKRYPKPYVALVDGIVMGGGVGVSMHGSHRVAGDKFVFAMPEVGIGYFPDVGATWMLPRLPGQLGTYCALTGERVGVDDAVRVGIATHRVSSGVRPQLLEALCGDSSVDAILASFAEPAGEGPMTSRQATIDRIFAADTVEEILGRLDEERGLDGEWAKATAATIRAKAPRSLKIALAQMRRGRDWTFEECMQAEFRIVSRVLYGEDLYEGVRALIVEKDNRPRWCPASVSEVNEAEVERHFAPLADELRAS